MEFRLNLIDGVMDHAGASVRRLRIAIQQVRRGLKRDSMSITLDQNVCSSELGPDATALLRSVPSGHVVSDKIRHIPLPSPSANHTLTLLLQQRKAKRVKRRRPLQKRKQARIYPRSMVSKQNQKGTSTMERETNPKPPR